MGVHYAAVFQSIGGIASAIAAGAAVYWAKRASDASAQSGEASERLAQIEDRRESERLARSDREQAELVSAWWRLGATPPFNSRMWSGWVRNLSNQPVSEVRVHFQYPASDGWGEAATVVAEVGIVPPGDTVQVNAPDNRAGPSLERVTVAVEFRDTGWRRWRRDERGQLHGPL